MKDAKKCVILVPVSNRIEPEVDVSLRILESRGYEVWRSYGHSAIDQGRCRMAYDALYFRNFEEIMWIDSDVGFDPDDFEKLRNYDLPIACGIYPIKGWPQMTAQFFGQKSIQFGKNGGLMEIRFSANGFLYTKRQVYEDIRKQFNMELCNAAFQHPIYPYFLPTVFEINDEYCYYGEDYSFCRRASKCGYKIMADTSIRLKHIGSYAYQWEDVENGKMIKKDSITVYPEATPFNEDDRTDKANDVVYDTPISYIPTSCPNSFTPPQFKPKLSLWARLWNVLKFLFVCKPRRRK